MSWPSEFKLKLPARVNDWSLPLPTTKKPLPWMATLVGTPVVWMLPCTKFGEIEPMVTPRPICAGSKPAPPTVWLTRSAKLTVLVL